MLGENKSACWRLLGIEGVVLYVILFSTWGNISPWIKNLSFFFFSPGDQLSLLATPGDSKETESERPSSRGRQDAFILVGQTVIISFRDSKLGDTSSLSRRFHGFGSLSFDCYLALCLCLGSFQFTTTYLLGKKRQNSLLCGLRDFDRVTRYLLPTYLGMQSRIPRQNTYASIVLLK